MENCWKKNALKKTHIIQEQLLVFFNLLQVFQFMRLNQTSSYKKIQSLFLSIFFPNICQAKKDQNALMHKNTELLTIQNMHTLDCASLFHSWHEHCSVLLDLHHHTLSCASPPTVESQKCQIETVEKITSVISHCANMEIGPED